MNIKMNFYSVFQKWFTEICGDKIQLNDSMWANFALFKGSTNKEISNKKKV